MRAKVDANHREIAMALEAIGCPVLSLAAVANGCPDLLVYNPRTRVVHMLEVKDGNKPPSHRKLTPHQVKFHQRWPCVQVVTCVDEALEAVHGKY